MNKIIALFVEGDTEIEFYKALINDIKTTTSKPFRIPMEYVNLKGIGNYKKDALRKFGNIKNKYPNADIYVFLCFDEDVFYYSKKPPVVMQEVKRSLLSAGAKSVKNIKANKSIEDWFLIDISGVLKFLRLSASTPQGQGKGLEKVQALFKKANRVYVKGSHVKGFVKALDMALIRKNICTSLKPLCTCMQLQCNETCP